MPSSLFSKLSLDFLPPSGLSPTRLPIDRISQERILEWGAFAYPNTKWVSLVAWMIKNLLAM